MKNLAIKTLILIAAMVLLLLPEAQADRPRYFVVGELNRTADDPQTMESYVVPIADQEQIEFARSIIGDETPPIMIVVAAIAPWSSPINRNYLLDNAPAWSWSVISFLQFAEGVLTVLDGRPSFVEANPDGWIKNTQGLIGFVGYTIIGELPIQPIYFLSDGTKRAFGAFDYYRDDFYPWIYFFDHGWMRIYGLDPFDIWLWDPVLGFLWTSETVYPMIYRQSDDSWLYFDGNKSSAETVRVFFNFRTLEYEEHPPAG